MNYSPNFTNYIKTTFEPAQAWALSTEGRSWIKKHIPKLDTLIETQYDSCIFGVYILRFNNIPWYCGESVRLVRRLCVHAWNLRFNSENVFGVTTEMLDEIAVDVEIVSQGLFEQLDRKSEELFWISRFKPVLQPNTGTDLCASRRLRKRLAQQALSTA